MKSTTMRQQHTAAEPIGRPETAVPILHGRWLLLAQALWIAFVVAALSLFIAAVPAHYAQLGDPPEAIQAGLEQLGLSVGFYATYSLALGAFFSLGCLVVAAVIFWRRSDDGMALLVSLMLALLGTVNMQSMEALAEMHPAWTLPILLSIYFASACFVLFLFLFPDGRFVPRWARIPALVWSIGLLSMLILLEFYPDAGALSEWAGLTFVGGTVAGAVAQIYRYVRVSAPEHRQQTKWVVFGTVAAIMGAGVASWLPTLFPSFTQPGLPALLSDLVGSTVVTVSLLLIPLTIGIAILRHRLWDIDLIINRTVVYGALSAIVIGLYVLVVGGLGALLQVRGNLAVSLVAAGLVAVLFAPLRDRLQRSVNRLMYGERDDPYAALSRLGQRLEVTLAPDAVLPAVTRTVTETLKLPYAAIEVRRDGSSFEVAATVGKPVSEPLRLPLTYGGETVGRLVLGRRAGEKEFSPADRRLLEALVRQIGAAVHAVRLTDEALRLSTDLQISREGLVTAREEERRRLRRDLHDGLGPQLASLTMKAEAARDLLTVDPARSEALLEDITARAQEAVIDVRRLVYGLRPPALDDLGLLGALRAQVAHGDHNELRVTIQTPDELPPLPAAVEVAVYRIVQEALTNAARHAEARNCAVCIALDEKVGVMHLEVTDDGRGIPEDRSAGVGFSSMRERAEELGGSCKVEALQEGGTRVEAALPLARSPQEAEAVEPGVREA